MKTISKFGLFCAATGVSVILGGCATEKVTVDYVMPAKAVTEVNKVNVAAIKVNSRVKGSLAGDNKRNAGLIKQLLAMCLYKEGFYQVTDDVWADPEKAAELAKLMNAKNPNHGYGETFVAGGQSKGKVVIELDLDLVLDSKPVKKEIPFSLSMVPYKQNPVKPGEMPTSSPDQNAIVTKVVKQPVTVYTVDAKGVLKARFVGVDGGAAPQKYVNSFSVSIPKTDRLSPPSQLEALAEAVTPAINGVVEDISPHKERRELVAIKGGDERVVHLLNAKAFGEVVRFVEERLEPDGKAVSADFENKGIAMEAMGDFGYAKLAYEKAIKANPESVSARAGIKRVQDALSGKTAVKESGAKQNADSKLSKFTM